jgi:hypothetical protein
MEFPIINTRSDLDAIAGTPAHAIFMTSLASTLWRTELDVDAGVWNVVEDDSTINRFGLTRADFPNLQPPEAPVYVAPTVPVPAVCTMRQARLALLGAGLLDDVASAIASMPSPDGDVARIEWEYATEVRRDSPLVAQMGQALEMDDVALDALFVQAVTM